MLSGVLFLLLVGGAAAQTSTNATCASTYDWASNSEGQSPCLVAADLQGVCNNDKWFIPSLPSGTHYVGPTSPQLATLCICNTVVYNLVSACAACQGGEWVSWADWTSNCSVSQMTRGSFPGPIPEGTSVPAWAEVDTSLEGTWNAVEARAVVGSGLPDIFPSSTSGTTSGTPTSSASPSQTSSTGKKTNVGAIVGGVIGGLAFLLLLLAIFFFLRMRKRRQSAARTAPIPLPTSYSSLSSRGASASGGTPPPGQGYTGGGGGGGGGGVLPSPGAEKSAFLSPTSAVANGNGAHSPPYSPLSPHTAHSPYSPGFPPTAAGSTGTGGTSTTLGAPSAAGGYVLYDPNNPSTWPTNLNLNLNLPTLPHSPSTPLSSTNGYPPYIPTSPAGFPSPGATAQAGQNLGTGTGGAAGTAAAVLDSDRAYSPVPTPAPTYRSSASPAPGTGGQGERVLLRGPERQTGKRRGGRR